MLHFKNLFLTFGFCPVLLAISCKQDAQTAPNNNSSIDVPSFTIVSKDTMVYNHYAANIQALQHTEIRSRVHGFLDKIFSDEGKKVTKGAPLFQLSIGEHQIDVAKALANLDYANADAKMAELEVERIDVLVKKNVVIKTELDLAKAKLKAAKAKIDEAKAVLEEAQLKKNYTTIKAPFDGMITRLALKNGSFIEEGTLLTSISDVSYVSAYFSVSEDAYLKLNKANKNGMKYDSVTLSLTDGSIYPLKGIIETNTGEIDPSTGSLTFRAKFHNPKGILKHGASGKIILPIPTKQALLVPQKAAFEIQDKHFVFVINKQNKVYQRSFEPAGRLGDFYIIKKGLQEGEKIVLEGIQNLKDGDVIKPNDIDMQSIRNYVKAD